MHRTGRGASSTSSCWPRHRPEGTPERVVVDSDPFRLLERLQTANRGGDAHLVGGPSTIETYRSLGALDEFRLMVLPFFAGAGRHVTPEVDATAALNFTDAKPWPTGVVELTYRMNG